MCFSLYLGIGRAGGGGGGGGLPRDWYTTCLCNFTLVSSKIVVSETYFFDIVITQYDHPRYVKYILGRIMCFSSYLGIGRGGGG